MTPGRRRLLVAGAVAAVALPLGACANSQALEEARQACDHVNRSVALFHRSDAAPPAAQAADRARALAELRRALPIAAIAAGQEPQWQALMTDIAEANRVPEADLVSSLHQLCSVADSPGGIGGGGNNPGLPGGGSVSTAPLPTG